MEESQGTIEASVNLASTAYTVYVWEPFVFTGVCYIVSYIDIYMYVQCPDSYILHV